MTASSVKHSQPNPARPSTADPARSYRPPKPAGSVTDPIQADRSAAYIMLAVHKYRAEHDRWPKTLAEATPGDLAQFRGDPFSGKDLIYRVVNEQPLLYSVGLDGNDDGGKPGKKGWDETGDEVFWSPRNDEGGESVPTGADDKWP